MSVLSAKQGAKKQAAAKKSTKSSLSNHDKIDISKKLVRTRLEKLRLLMKKNGTNAHIILSSDIHFNEYLPPCFKEREFMSAFTGSAGALLVQDATAQLFTDGRYHLQAQNELQSTGISLAKQGKSATFADFLHQSLEKGDVLSLNPKQMSISSFIKLKKTLKAKKIKYKFTDFICILMNEPALYKDKAEFEYYTTLPKSQLFIHKKAGKTLNQKLQLLRAKMRELNATHHFISTLDDIAWTLNLRGFDIDFNPLFLSFLLISEKSATLFVDKNKLKPALRGALKRQGVDLREYDEVEVALKSLKKANDLSPLNTLKSQKSAKNSRNLSAKNSRNLQPLSTKNVKNSLRDFLNLKDLQTTQKAPKIHKKPHILIDESRTSLYFKPFLKPYKLIKATNPSTLMKARKSKGDILNIKNAMVRDGVALCEFFADFEWRLKRRERLRETDIDGLLTAQRAKQQGFLSNSFATIAGFGANAALPHYTAKKGKDALIAGTSLLLIDSGAHYDGGTTDITRVAAIGRALRDMKRDYTLVLKALIALSRAKFPKNLALPQLDSLARAGLWEAGLDYAHGTGHGVGLTLNVHEAPIRISCFASTDKENVAFEGVVSSVEPGIYRAGKYGIRLENLVFIKRANVKERDFGEFLCFETLTLCPFEPALIELSLLNATEKKWLNDYHKGVFAKLSPFLKDKALEWLKAKTMEI